MFEWGDLRYFLAVARHGSTLAAAKALGVSQSTVQRRIVELERQIGRPVVTRHATGYQLTEFGQLLRPHAERVEEAVAALSRHVLAAQNELAGTLRVTCPEPLVARLTRSPLLDLFRQRYPAVEVELISSDRYLDLSKGEADIALRSGEPADNSLVGRKISDSPWAVYASHAYLERHGRPDIPADLNTHTVVGFDGALEQHRAARWLRQVAPHARVAARNNSVLGVVAAVKSGLGISPLPCALGDEEPDLVRVFEPSANLSSGWYLLTHPDLRNTPRVRAFIEFIVENRELMRPILTGQPATAGKS